MAKGAHSDKQKAAAEKLGRASRHCKVKKKPGKGGFQQCIKEFYKKHPGHSGGSE